MILLCAPLLCLNILASVKCTSLLSSPLCKVRSKTSIAFVSLPALEYLFANLIASQSSLGFNRKALSRAARAFGALSNKSSNSASAARISLLSGNSVRARWKDVSASLVTASNLVESGPPSRSPLAIHRVPAAHVYEDRIRMFARHPLEASCAPRAGKPAYAGRRASHWLAASLFPLGCAGCFAHSGLTAHESPHS